MKYIALLIATMGMVHAMNPGPKKEDSKEKRLTISRTPVIIPTKSGPNKTELESKEKQLQTLATQFEGDLLQLAQVIHNIHKQLAYMKVSSPQKREGADLREISTLHQIRKASSEILECGLITGVVGSAFTHLFPPVGYSALAASIIMLMLYGYVECFAAVNKVNKR